MKHNFSDLLDEVLVDDIDLNEKTLLSSRRIKERTMGKIGQKKTNTLRWLPRVAVIAAVIMALTVTAYAVDTVFNDGELFKEVSDQLFFNGVTSAGFDQDTTGTTTKPFSGSQEELIDDMDRNFGESISSNGTTITPIRGLADQNNYYLYLRVETPEGVVLPDVTDEYYYAFDYRGQWENRVELFYCVNAGTNAEYWDEAYINCWARVLEDEDPTDNVKYFVLQISTNVNGLVLNGPHPKKLVIHNLHILKKYDPSGDIELFTGRFAFDITIVNENRDEQSLVLKPKDLTFYNEEYDYTTIVNRITITSLGIDLDITYTQPSDKYIFPYGGPVQLVMKDGRTIDVLEGYYNAKEHWYPHPDSIVGVGSSSRFDEPIVVGEIDYLLFNGEIIVDVN